MMTNDEYTYDTLGRRQTLGYPNGVTATWGYDDLGRLASLVHDNNVSSFGYTEYDKVGNRQAITANGINTTYNYDNYQLVRKNSGEIRELTPIPCCRNIQDIYSLRDGFLLGVELGVSQKSHTENSFINQTVIRAV